jgi:hypothetical protein
MDVSNASYYIQTMKITKIKVAKWGTPKNIKISCEIKKKLPLQKWKPVVGQKFCFF